MRFFVFSLLAATFALPPLASAQKAPSGPAASTEARPARDARLDAAFAAFDIAAEVDAAGEYSVDLRLETDRVQTIYARSVTETINGIEVREVYSLAVGQPEPTGGVLDPALAVRLLDANAELAFGAWASENGVVFFHVYVPADAPPEAFMDAFWLVGAVADELETALSDADEL